MTSHLEISLPKYCGISDFEALLKKYYERSATTTKSELIFDFSKLDWIGALQTSILFGWMASRTKSHKVIARIDSLSRGVQYLQSHSFFSNLAEFGVSTIGVPVSVSSELFSLFRRFGTKEEFKSYEDALASREHRTRLWPRGTEISIVKEGELQDILLRELIDNCFIHGSGECVRFMVSEFGADPTRRPHKLLSRFDGQAYLEVVASDSGLGLLNRLKAPVGYQPDCGIQGEPPEDFERTVAYAFEFASTGDEIARQSRILEILQRDDGEAEFVASGLWYVMRLAKKHSAQILIRTGKVLVSLDFTSESMAIKSVAGLIEVPGTHIVFRCPRDRQLAVVRPQTPVLIDAHRSVCSVVLEELRETSDQDSLFVLRAQAAVQGLLNRRSERGKPMLAVVVLCDGLHVDHKAFSLLLLSFAAMDRRGHPLVLAGMRRELFEGAIEEWNRVNGRDSGVKKISGNAITYQSFVLVRDDLTNFGTFGDRSQPESTVLGDHNSNSGKFLLSESEAIGCYGDGLRDAIARHLDERPVKHAGNDKYYLIERNYYTREFFEIAKISNRSSTTAVVASWLALTIWREGITSVFVIAEPLFPLTRAVEASTPDCAWFYANPNNDLTQFVKAVLVAQKTKRLMVLTDVICRARQFARYLNKTSFDELVLGALIDGRSPLSDHQHGYLTVTRPQGPHAIHILAAKRHPIETVDDLPPGVDFRQVRIVDPRTHSPTTYECIEEPTGSSEFVLDQAVNARSIVHGHFSFDGKHYKNFIYFSRLFPAIAAELRGFWGNALANLLALGKLTPNDVYANYLDERRGWEHVIENYLASSGLVGYQSIRRTDLMAPPDSPTDGAAKSRGVWFILPAIANGETVRLCLEYAWRSGPSYIYISICIGRLDAARLSFYQNISAYRGIPVRIEVYAYLPLLAAPSMSSCSYCEVLGVLQRINSRLSERVTLSRIVSERTREYLLTEITLESIEQGEIQPVEKGFEERLLVRMMLEQAPRNYEKRKDLGSYLDAKGDEGLKLLLEVIGEDFLSPKLSQEIVDRATYTRFSQAEAFAAKALAGQDLEMVSLKFILGCNRLFPHILTANFRDLLSLAIHNDCPRLAEDLTFCALLYPERYAMPLLMRSGTLEGKAWAEPLFADVSAHMWSALDSEGQIGTFIDLHDFLRRSTEWGTTIDILRKQLRSDQLRSNSSSMALSPERVQALNSFLAKAIDPLDEYLSRLRSASGKSAGGLWQAISAANPDVANVLESFYQGRVALRRIVQLRGGELGEALDCLRQLQELGKQLKACLERLFTNPVNVKRDIEELMVDSNWASDFRVSFSIAPDQPGLLIERDDLRKSLVHVLDNVDERVKELRKSGVTDEYWLEFRFCGVDEGGLRTPVVVRHNVFFDRSLVPSGGLKEFMKICARYGAIHEFLPEVPEDPYIKIRTLYRIMDERDRHEHD